ncbi:DUF1059 domain-containing protein [Haloferax gibbonsii]|uniref:DUF1059 domain-containing protein n=1 Tax=Haloferax gibbonsii TaxID=35746 RepID=UPI0009D988CC|nr:DUF1059 domain-containing protein [Haloferax gibbonsii]
MPFKTSCLSGCGATIEGESPEEVGVLLMEHMEDAHNTPVDPLEVSEFAIEVNRTGPMMTTS